MTIFEILDSLVIVNHDSERQWIITWNKSNTLLLWSRINDTEFENIDVRTHGGECLSSFEAAEAYSHQWLKDLWYLDNCSDYDD